MNGNGKVTAAWNNILVGLRKGDVGGCPQVYYIGVALESEWAAAPGNGGIVYRIVYCTA